MLYPIPPAFSHFQMILHHTSLHSIQCFSLTPALHYGTLHTVTTPLTGRMSTSLSSDRQHIQWTHTAIVLWSHPAPPPQAHTFQTLPVVARALAGKSRPAVGKGRQERVTTSSSFDNGRRQPSVRFLYWWATQRHWRAILNVRDVNNDTIWDCLCNKKSLH